MKLLTELKVDPQFDNLDILHAIKKKYRLFPDEIEKFEIVKKSIDSRKKPNIAVILNVAVKVQKFAEKKVAKCTDIYVDHSGLEYNKVDYSGKRPVIVGFGPSGIFAGLALALSGYKPIILEQGKSVEERQKDIDEFFAGGKLNKFSNVQFGEGGAGTFSDGKLASNVSNEYTKKVINEFIINGAPEEIFYSNTPHIGSDKLKEIIKTMRTKIEKNGGKIIFNAHFDDFKIKNGMVNSVLYTDVESGEQKELKTNTLILAVGHSAVDVYRLLKDKNCVLEQKPFAMGVRIEQNQKEINYAQYGGDDTGLPPANYKLVEHLPNGRSVYTFCMCPGGTVMASQSEEGTVVTNGMSNYLRDGKNANSALLVNVTPEDFGSDDPLAGVDFQHKYEKLAFELGGSDYSAPAELVGDFMAGEENPSDNFGFVQPTYLPRVKIADLRKCLPDFVYESLKLALPEMNKKIKGFADEKNILVGVESRSSAPVQIIRDPSFMTSIDGLFACGEGSGYAGGITTSAQDGIKCAENVIKYIKKIELNKI